MNKGRIKLYISAIVLVAGIEVNAQAEAWLEEKIEQRIKDYAVLVRQDYVIKSPGTEYGFRGESYFGREYTVGFLADSFVYYRNAFENMWNRDSNFESLANVDTLTPQFAGLAYRHLNDTAYFTLQQNKAFNLAPQIVVALNDNEKSRVLTSQSLSEVVRHGCVVAFYTEESVKPSQLDEAELKVKVWPVNFKVNTDSINDLLIFNFPEELKNVVGGAYLNLNEIDDYSLGIHFSGLLFKQGMFYKIAGIHQIEDIPGEVNIDVINALSPTGNQPGNAGDGEEDAAAQDDGERDSRRRRRNN